MKLMSLEKFIEKVQKARPQILIVNVCVVNGELYVCTPEMACATLTWDLGG